MASPPSPPPAPEGFAAPPAQFPAPPAAPAPPWTLADVALVALLFFIAINLFELIAIAAAVAYHVDGASLAALRSRRMLTTLLTDVRVTIPPQLAAYLVGLWAMVRTAHQRHRLPFFRALPWHWPQGKWFAFAIAGAALWLGVSLLSQVLPIPRTMPIEQAFSSPTAAWVLVVFGIAVAPFMEELFFRGLLYPAFARHTGQNVSILLTSVLFALLHSPQLANAWGPVLVLFLVGLALTLVRAHTGSVAAAMVVHIGYNAAIFTALLVATDGFRHLERIPH